VSWRKRSMEMLNRLIVESLRKSSHFACHSKPSGECTEFGVEKSFLHMMNRGEVTSDKDQRIRIKDQGKMEQERVRVFSERLLKFVVNTIKFLRTLPHKKEYDVFKYQLLKSSSSIGANYEEAQACSKSEFKQRISNCLREARETHYWLKVLDRLKIGDDEKRKYLMKEANEIKLIFGSIHSKIHVHDLKKT